MAHRAPRDDLRRNVIATDQDGDLVGLQLAGIAAIRTLAVDAKMTEVPTEIVFAISHLEYTSTFGVIVALLIRYQLIGTSKTPDAISLVWRGCRLSLFTDTAGLLRF